MRMGSLRFHRRGKGVIRNRNKFGSSPRKGKKPFKPKSNSFKKESYKRFSSLLSSSNTHLQTFLAAFSSSIMAIDIALLILFMNNLESQKIREAYLKYTSLFTVCLVAFFVAIFIIFIRRIFIIWKIKRNVFNIENEQYNYEYWLTIAYIIILTACTYFAAIFIYIVWTFHSM